MWTNPIPARTTIRPWQLPGRNKMFSIERKCMHKVHEVRLKACMQLMCHMSSFQHHADTRRHSDSSKGARLVYFTRPN